MTIDFLPWKTSYETDLKGYKSQLIFASFLFPLFAFLEQTRKKHTWYPKMSFNFRFHHKIWCFPVKWCIFTFQILPSQLFMSNSLHSLSYGGIPVYRSGFPISKWTMVMIIVDSENFASPLWLHNKSNIAFMLFIKLRL